MLTSTWPRLPRAPTGPRLAVSAVLVSMVLAGCGLGGSTPQTTAATRGSGSSAPASPSASPSVSVSPKSSPEPSATPSPSKTAEPAGFTFPIKASTHFGRAHHDYPATDIFAACGSTVVAPTDGVISEVSRKDTWKRSVNDGASRGGLSFSMVGAKGVRYYGSHLRSIGTSIRPGVAVEQGDVIGRVGKTGDAVDVPCHLHFGISPACGTGDWWVRRGVISPYRYLKAWQRGEDLSPAKGVADWKAKNGCPRKPPKGY